MSRFSRKCLSAITLISLALPLVPACYRQGRRGDVIGNIPLNLSWAILVCCRGDAPLGQLSETTFRIHGVNEQGVLVQTHGVERKAPESATRMIFHRYGHTYFLSEIWVAGNRIGR
jgi:hypothetical protein